MPRELPIGNGQLLVNFDRNYFLRDLYFPRVGQENQTVGHPNRFGVWVDGYLAWLDDPAWHRHLDYLPSALVTRVELHHPHLRLRLSCNDAVDCELPVYLKKVVVINPEPREREVRLFFHQDFHISQSEVGDTAYYEPVNDILIHYKGKRYFVINALAADARGLHQYATGVKELGNMVGTWCDAADGLLGGNPIAQGSVDSTIAVHVVVPATSSSTVYYWICAGRDFFEVRNLNREVLTLRPATMISRTQRYWETWVTSEDSSFGDLSQDLIDLYRRSLMITRSQIDNGGAIIAANDGDTLQFRDTYCYMWPRDGAIVASAIDESGRCDVARRFFEFCARLIAQPTYYSGGYLLHKYNPDGSLGSSWHPWIRHGQPKLPVQEDETALVVWAAWRHFEKHKDVEFARPIYHQLVKPAAGFLIDYRDQETGLPKESYDLWEERYGVLTFTCATVFAGLQAAARFARTFGEEDAARQYERVAHEVREAMTTHLYSADHGRFLRMISYDNGQAREDPTVDSSLAALFILGVFRPDDARVVNTMRAIEDQLWVKTPIGGVARYQRDWYQAQTEDWDLVPGNPWFVCTLWLAEWHIAMARTVEDLQKPRQLLKWVAMHACPGGVLAEQLHPFTGAPLSVSPLTWSHAAYIHTVHQYARRFEAIRSGRTNNVLQAAGLPVG